MSKLTRFQLTNLISNIHDYNIDHNTRSLYIYGEITQELCECFIKNFNLLNDLSQEEITVYLNSEGGDTYEGFAIYDCIKDSECQVTIVVYGQCCSMASIILQAGDERVLSSSSIVMMHEGSVYIADNMNPANKYIRDVQRAHKLSISIYIEACQESDHYKDWTPRKLKTFIEDKVGKEWYLPAEEAVKLGFADKVL